MYNMPLMVKGLVCVVTVILAWSQADAFPSVWKRDASSLANTVPGVCNSSICQQDATEILESLDKSVDPCDDFYMFACGGWKKKHPATNDTPVVNHHELELKTFISHVELTLKESISEDDISPLKAAKKMYQICMDVDAIKRAGILPLVDISKEFGGWPMAVEHWDEENFSVENALAVVYRYLAQPPLLRVSAKISLIDRARRDLNIEEPGCGSYVCEHNSAKLDDPEFKGKITSASIYVMNSTGVHFNEDSVQHQASQVVDFLRKVDNISFTGELAHDMITIKELQEWTDSAFVANTYSRFNWLSYLNKILSDTDIVLDENEYVTVFNKEYLLKLVKLLDNTPRRVLANYLQWILIEEQQSTLEKLTQDPLVGSFGVETRSFHCSQETFQRFRVVLNSHLARTIYSDEDKAHFNTLVENLRSEIKDTINSIGWLDVDERSMLLDKVNTLKAYSGYPDIYNNEPALVEYYKQVHVGNDHIRNMLLPPKHIRDMLPLLRKRVNEADEQLDTVNPTENPAFFVDSLNAVFVPIGNLQQFQFKVGRLETLNYGRIGVSLGHGISHAILNAYTNIPWNRYTQSMLFVKGMCFVDQYNNYHVQELEEDLNTSITVNGYPTAFENIADNTGIYAAYESYQTYVKQHGTEQTLHGLEEYSPNQMFFIGFATSMCDSRTLDELHEQFTSFDHIPEFARVRGSVSNMEQFATAFNCPAGSNMNPVNKCRVW